jgi:hypothetical protein
MIGRLEIEVIDIHEKSVKGIDLTKAEKEETRRLVDEYMQKEYAQAVEQGRALVKAEGDVQWRMGDLACTVATRYGDKTFKNFAADIGVNVKTLSGYRSTASAWPKNTPRGEFSICRELNAHPDRHKILEDNPEMTNREAAQIAREYRREQSEAETVESYRARDGDVWGEMEKGLARLDERLKAVKETMDAITADDRIVHLDVGFPQRRKTINSHLKLVGKIHQKIIAWDFIMNFVLDFTKQSIGMGAEWDAAITEEDRKTIVRLEQRRQQSGKQLEDKQEEQPKDKEIAPAAPKKKPRKKQKETNNEREQSRLEDEA